MKANKELRELAVKTQKLADEARNCLRRFEIEYKIDYKRDNIKDIMWKNRMLDKLGKRQKRRLNWNVQIMDSIYRHNIL